MSLEQTFAEAQERVKTLPRRPGNERLLQLYALYKQATVGDVAGKRPGMLDLVGRSKYDAWAARKGLAPEAAMQEYVTLVEALLRAQG